MIYSKVDDIVRVITHERKKVGNYYWISNPTYLGVIMRRPGVYRPSPFTPFPVSTFVSLEPRKNEVLHDQALCYKPHDKFEHKNGKITKKFFETPEELNTFVENFVDESGVLWVSND